MSKTAFLSFYDWVRTSKYALALVLMWVFLGPGVLGYTVVPVSPSLSFLRQSDQMVVVAMAGWVTYVTIFTIGMSALHKIARRERVYQRWLRRYANRPVRPRPLA